MSVPTATILISQDKDAVSKVLQKLGSGAKIVNIIDETSRDDGVLLFSNHANPNFISFEHNLVGSDLEGTLEFIDPKNEFEENFLSSRSVFASLKHFLSKFKNAPTPKSELERRISESSKKSVSDLPDPTSKEVRDIAFADRKKNFYICFGIGNNTRYWSKVQRVELTKITLDPSKSRKFTLKFAALSRPLSKNDRVGLYNDTIDLDTLGNSTSVVGYGQAFNLYNYFKNGELAYGDPQRSPNYPVDLHLMITDTIRRYIRKAALGANVIVLMPDLNNLCGERFNKIFGESKTGSYNVENLRMALYTFLSEIGMSLDMISASDIPPRYPVEVTALVEKVEADPLNRVAWDYSTYSYYPTLTARSNKGIPDFMGPLRTCMEKINLISQAGYTFTATYVDETDTKVLELWEALNTHTFNGYEDFDSDSPTIIVGDTAIISNYLYNEREESDGLPLHYTDEILENVGYKKAIKELVGVFDNEYVFGDLYKAPDTFGYLEADLFNPTETKLIESEKIPIFKYNTANPNVLDMQAKDSGTYFTNLNVTFSKAVDRIASTIREGGVNVALANFPITTIEGLYTAIILSKFSQFGPTLSDKKIIDAVLKRISPELESELDLPPLIEDRVKVIKGLIDYLSSNNNNVTVHIDQEINGTPAVLLDKFSDFLTKVKRKVVVKTLPFFNLSNRSLVNSSPCILFAQDAPVLSQVTQNRTRFNVFLTGIYGIVGFRHKITSRGVFSEFTIIKQEIENRYDTSSITGVEDKPSSTETLPPPAPKEDTSSSKSKSSTVTLPSKTSTTELKASDRISYFMNPDSQPKKSEQIPYGGT